MNANGWLVAAGLTAAASVHCAGMCGGFVLALAVRDRQRRLRLLGDQVLLHVGKATTYAFLGALAGVFGGALMRSPALRVGGQALAIAAAILLAIAGAALLGLRRTRPQAWTVRLAGLWQRFLGPLLAERPAGSSLVVGLALGTLPCPLVYAGLAAAAATGSPAQGAAILAGVALGTVPMLAAVALVGVSLSPRSRQMLARAGGVLLILMALVTFVRALGHEGHAVGGGHGGHGRHAPGMAAPVAPTAPTPASPGSPASPPPGHRH